MQGLGVLLLLSQVWDPWSFFKLLDSDGGGFVEIEEPLWNAFQGKEGRWGFMDQGLGVYGLGFGRVHSPADQQSLGSKRKVEPFRRELV